MRSDFAAVDAIVSHYFDRGAQPAISYGVVSGGVLVHSAGFGARGDGRPAPDADTVFRIASMSKSFTASAVLLLRDEGRLALDDPAEKYVPELAGWPSVTPDSDRVTIRHLLTMTAGFPTDDPWGDRQQGLPLDEFGALLAGGVRFNWAPGTRFEYSNLGYAILGRIVAAAAQADVRRVRRDPAARAARHDPHRIRRGRVRPPASWRPATGAVPRAGRSCRSTRTARSRRWAGCSPRVSDLARLGGRLRGGVPARRWLATPTGRTRCAGRRGGRCSSRRR